MKKEKRQRNTIKLQRSIAFNDLKEKKNWWKKKFMGNLPDNSSFIFLIDSKFWKSEI